MRNTEIMPIIKGGRKKVSVARKIFVCVNHAMLILLLAACIFPFLNLLAVSLSQSNAVNAGAVTIFPVDFTWKAYQYLLEKAEFFRAFGMSFARVALGTVVSMAVMILMAYPLSLEKGKFAGKKFYLALCIIAMFFSGGLIPTFMVIRSIYMYDTIWALVLPGALNCWQMILLINFFRRIPKDLIEYASVEGAGHFRVLFSIILPLSLPVLATVALFTIVGHWNAWFDGYIYRSSPNYPLQTYIYNMLETLKTLASNPYKTPYEIELLQELGDSTLRSAQVFVAMVPIILVYPFMQRFFVKGLLLGSVKE